MQNNPAFRRLLLIASIAMLSMSIVPVLIRWTSANEITIGLIRLSIGALGIGIILLFQQQKIRLKTKEIMWLILLGVIFAAHWLTYFTGIKQAGASLASIGVATFGVHLLILDFIINRQKLNITDIFAIVLSFTGMLITSPPESLAPTQSNGFIFAIISGFLYACLPLINRKIPHLKTNIRAFAQFFVALIIFLLLLPKADFNLSSADWLSLAVLGIVSTLLAHTLWIKASTELPTNITAIIYYAYVPIAVVLSFVFLNEPLTSNKIIGAGLIIGANILIVLLHKPGVKR
ncbi:DMT family transporter [Aliikangiella maris]|uniref:DMT family transporter n=2 Tax=Aliikangiella maris TaxID=3162458 RepID=A0ABV3MRW8_9GAMM